MHFSQQTLCGLQWTHFTQVTRIELWITSQLTYILSLLAKGQREKNKTSSYHQVDTFIIHNKEKQTSLNHGALADSHFSTTDSATNRRVWILNSEWSRRVTFNGIKCVIPNMLWHETHIHHILNKYQTDLISSSTYSNIVTPLSPWHPVIILLKNNTYANKRANKQIKIASYKST